MAKNNTKYCIEKGQGWILTVTCLLQLSMQDQQCMNDWINEWVKYASMCSVC